MTFLKAITPLIAALAAVTIIYLLMAGRSRKKKAYKVENEKADKEIKDYLLDTLDECEIKIS